MATLLGFDRSHHNDEPDFAAFRAGGGAFVFCKATDGVGWTDPTFAACRAGTHAAGLVFGSYHFAEWGDPAAEASWYLQVASPRPGELVALDAEAAVPAGVDVAAWSLAWCQAVHAAVGAWPLIYMNQSWASAHNWAPVAANDGLWLAKYDGVPTGTPVGGWPVLTMKQYTDAGSIPGEAGQVDADAFQGDLATLLKYAVPGAAPAPISGEDMPLTDADVTKLYWGTPFRGAENFAQIIDAIQDTANANSAKIDTLAAAVASLAAKVDALATGGVDPTAVQAAARQGAADALSKTSFTVVGDASTATA